VKTTSLRLKLKIHWVGTTNRKKKKKKYNKKETGERERHTGREREKERGEREGREREREIGKTLRWGCDTWYKCPARHTKQDKFGDVSIRHVKNSLACQEYCVV
jgi:hypothetical protein